MSKPDANGWLPIETAPKDGTAILISLKSGRCTVADWRQRWMCWATDAGSFPESSMRCWQPLPMPPVQP